MALIIGHAVFSLACLVYHGGAAAVVVAGGDPEHLEHGKRLVMRSSPSIAVERGHTDKVSDIIDVQILPASSPQDGIWPVQPQDSIAGGTTRVNSSIAGPERLALVLFLTIVVLCFMAVGGQNERIAVIAQAMAPAVMYILVSSLMIESNKWLMHKDRFPYPVTLTASHMFVSFMLAVCLRMVAPSCFPALDRVEVNFQFLRKFLPIGIPFALSIVCGNWAYKYLSVSFLQIMKESNIVTIYVLSVLVGLEDLRRSSIILLLCVFSGGVMAIHGELHFVLAGFMLQVVSSLSEAAKVILQSLLMNGETRLDPLSMVIFMAPVCWLATMVLLYFIEGSQIRSIGSAFIALWPVIVGNTCLAFVLNATVALCIKRLSAVGYLLCGVVKDSCIVITSAVFLGETLSALQVFGFGSSLAGVGLYSLYKQNPECFEEDNLLYGFQRVFRVVVSKI